MVGRGRSVACMRRGGGAKASNQDDHDDDDAGEQRAAQSPRAVEGGEVGNVTYVSLPLSLI